VSEMSAGRSQRIGPPVALRGRGRPRPRGRCRSARLHQL